jgi:membrane protein DedA with SNARE-associated domain
MISNVLLALAVFIKTVISSMGYPGIVLLMAIESACIPLPSEVIMPFSGYNIWAGAMDPLFHIPFRLLLVATAGALGCNLGSLFAYEVGYYGGRPLVERYGSLVLLSRRELDLADRFFARFGDITVFVSRLLPVIRTFIALPAGVARMPRARFHLYTFLGSWPWCLALAWIGLKLGEKWDTDPRLKLWFHRFDALIGVFLAAGIVWFLWSRWQHRIRAENAT